MKTFSWLHTYLRNKVVNLEKIDFEKLNDELYSVIAHASAGTDFCSPDLQMAVNECIEEFKKELKRVTNKC